MVDDGKVLELECGCDSIWLNQRYLKSNGKEKSVSQNNARYTGFASTGTLVFSSWIQQAQHSGS